MRGVNWQQFMASVEGGPSIIKYHAAPGKCRHILNHTTLIPFCFRDTIPLRCLSCGVQELLNSGYRVLIYSGQLDIIVANSLTQAFIDALQWNGKEDFIKV